MAPLLESWRRISSWLWTGSCSSKRPSICHITNIQHVQLEPLTACRCQSSCYFKRFCTPPPAPVPRHASAADGSSDCCSPTPTLCRHSGVVLLVFLFLPWRSSSSLMSIWPRGVVVGSGGRGGSKAQQQHSFKHWYIFIKTSTLLIFFSHVFL